MTDGIGKIIQDYINLRDTVQALMAEMQDEAADTENDYMGGILNEWILDLTAALETNE